jgi:hypothetical protein
MTIATPSEHERKTFIMSKESGEPFELACTAVLVLVAVVMALLS